jgi:hypothetical protein
MSRHRQHCLPAKPDQPSTLAIWAGAAFALLAVWLITVFFFSL